MIVRAIAVAVFLTLAVLLVPRSAAAQEPRFFFCFASNIATSRTYVSDNQLVGVISERAQYGRSFSDHLSEKGLVTRGTAGFCVMRATEQEVDKGRSELPASCGTCDGAESFEAVAWNRGGQAVSGKITLADSSNEPDRSDCAPETSTSPPRPGTYRPKVIDARCGWPDKVGPPTPSTYTPKVIDARNAGADAQASPESGLKGGYSTARRPVQSQSSLPTKSAAASHDPSAASPSEIAAPLPHSAFVQLHPPSERAFVQLHTQFFLCGKSIYLSYSLRPVEPRKINQVKFWGTVDGNFGQTIPFSTQARATPGHALGCAYQRVEIAPLSAYEHRLTSGQFTNGDDVWTREDRIRHLLGGFHVFAMPSPWPSGAIGAPTQSP